MELGRGWLSKSKDMRSVLVLNSLCFAWQVWLHQGVALRWGRSYALYSQGPCSNVANEGLFSCVGDANLCNQMRSVLNTWHSTRCAALVA